MYLNHLTQLSAKDFIGSWTSSGTVTLFAWNDYSNRVLLTTVCLFITNYLAKLSVKPIIKFKKTLRNFLLEKSFYSVEEFMTVDS
jgi:hypothetical protein